MATIKLTVAQFRILRRIPDEGLSQTSLKEGRNYDFAAKVRILQILIRLGLVVETASESGAIRFQITNAGRELACLDKAVPKHRKKGTAGHGDTAARP